ncbi:Putative uncharacterized protein [Moritella viscosa]|nr:Putative uncharacterized protein [Moritella viscosa]SHO20939.1 Putative uncharacterized protein [Moritella viscosa]
MGAHNPSKLFLSCLYGSEPLVFFDTRPCLFLSCLYGSELTAGVVTVSALFLSCLYGSEQKTSKKSPD